MKLDQLMDKYNLSDFEFQEIQQNIIDIYTWDAFPSVKPTAIILGGQPGAGKSELITAAQRLAKISNETLVICNADDFTDFHPLSDEIKKDHEKYYPEITVRYAQGWNNGLRHYCEQQKFNYVLETTFSSGDLMNDTIQNIKEKGL